MNFAWLAVLLFLQDPTAPIELKVRPTAGDKIETFYSWTHTFRGKLGEEHIRASSRGGRRLVLEMAKVDGGRLTRLGVSITDAYVEEQDLETLKYVRKDEAFHGRKATVALSGGREVCEGLDGVPESLQKQLSLVDPLTRLFPDRSVKVGDTWEFGGEEIKKLYVNGDFTDGKVTVTLRDVKAVNGRRCALLATTHDVSGKEPGGAARELRMTGTLTVWIDRGYVLEMAQTGRLKTTGADPKTGQPDGEAAVTGQLTATPVEK